ncbi:MAG: hypothetical protein V4757_07035 [Pseudomonadota bacterium]
MNSFYRDNGILARIPGGSLGPARDGLPPADSDKSPTHVTVETDAEYAGRVRVTFERKKFTHRKSWHWGWVAVHAEQIGPSPWDGVPPVEVPSLTDGKRFGLCNQERPTREEKKAAERLRNG